MMVVSPPGGNVCRIGDIRTTNAVTVGNGTPRVEQYGYDNLHRLVSANYGDGGVQDYTFDAMGNRLSKIEGMQGTLYTYNAANMLLTRDADAYLNDANGNTLSGGGRTNTWDSQNRLVQCVSGGNTSQIVYGADGLRRTSIVNGNPVHSVLDSGMMVREMVPSGQTLIPKATYLIGPRGPEYRRDDQTQAIRWYLYDGLGSVLGEVDPLGNLTASREYDVYGLVGAGDNGTSRHKFVGSLGHTSEDETGLIYMRARWMDPALGRFISEDPGRDGANWFEYCRGNPVNLVDGTGQSPIVNWPGLFGRLLSLAATLGAMTVKAQFNKPFACLFASWSACIGLEVVGWLTAHGSQSEAGRLVGIAAMLEGAFMTAYVFSSPSEITANLTIAGQVESFYTGYVALLAATILVLDIEVEHSLGYL